MCYLTYLASWLLLPAASLFAQVTATVNVNPAQSTPLNPNFSGFNYEGATSYEPYDYKFNGGADLVAPGWIRYPGGFSSDAFSWQTGYMLPMATITEYFSTSSFYTNLTENIAEFGGKGGQHFLDVGNQAKLLGAKIIVDFNGYTDTPESAAAMVQFAQQNNIPVAIWELCNEAYFFTSTFFPTGYDYAQDMYPFYQAIKGKDPNAIVALFFSDPATQRPAWDSSLASYSPQYWDAIVYHFYGQQSSGTNFAQWMADENAGLYTLSASYITNYVQPLVPSTKYFEISEFNPTSGDLGNGPGLTDGTVYCAVYAAEYIMRMSTVPTLLHVGMHALSSEYGVNANDRHASAVQAAYSDNTTIDTATLDYGFFPSAQAEGVGLLNGVLQDATQVYTTSVTGGATVTATGLSPIPALYAQGYSNAAGYQSVMITNKSATVHQVTIELNGLPANGTFPIQYINATDPSTTNTSTTEMPVTIVSTSSANPVTVPPYSVVRVDLNGGITIETYPPGLQFTVDSGAAQTGTQFLNLSTASHTIAVNATQAGTPGTQYVFTGWSDGGAASHSISVTSGVPATYIAYFKAQYRLTESATPAGAGTVSPASGTYYDAGSQITLTATAKTPFAFNSWSGGAGGATSASSVIMNMPQSVTAGFVNTTQACNITGDVNTSAADVQAVINQALGMSLPQSDLNGDSVVNVADVQVVVESALGKGCFAA